MELEDSSDDVQEETEYAEIALYTLMSDRPDSMYNDFIREFVLMVEFSDSSFTTSFKTSIFLLYYFCFRYTFVNSFNCW